MVENPKVSGDDLVLNDCSRRNVNLVALVGDDDDGAFEHDALAEGHVAGDGQMVQFNNVRNGGKAFEKIIHLEQEEEESKAMMLRALKVSMYVLLMSSFVL